VHGGLPANNRHADPIALGAENLAAFSLSALGDSTSFSCSQKKTAAAGWVRRLAWFFQIWRWNEPRSSKRLFGGRP